MCKFGVKRVGGLRGGGLDIRGSRLGMGCVRLGVGGIEEVVQGRRVVIRVVGLSISRMGLRVSVILLVTCGVHMGIGIGVVLGSSGLFGRGMFGHGFRMCRREREGYMLNVLTYIFICIRVS